jgi:hypothetical protein
MAIDLQDLVTNMLAAAEGAAKGHWADLKNYLQARAQLIAEGVQQITDDRLTGKIDDDDVKFAFNQIKESESTQLDAMAVTTEAAAQDAINAALAVAATAINKAVGVALL